MGMFKPWCFDLRDASTRPESVCGVEFNGRVVHAPIQADAARGVLVEAVPDTSGSQYVEFKQYFGRVAFVRHVPTNKQSPYWHYETVVDDDGKPIGRVTCRPLPNPSQGCRSELVFTLCTIVVVFAVLSFLAINFFNQR